MLFRVCKKSELDDDSMNRFEAGGTTLLLAKVGENFFAGESFCTHEEADLSLGILNDSIITCPLHQAKFDLKSGNVLEGPNVSDPKSIRNLRIYPTKVENDEVFVEL